METKRIVIGRDPASCDIKIDQAFDTVSNNHAVITLEGNTYIFTDNSSNGTLINGKKVHNKSVEVQPGDTIALAGTVIVTWEEISRLLPLPKTPVSRPTVQQSIQPESLPPTPPLQGEGVQPQVQPQPVQPQVQQPQPQQPAQPVQPQVQSQPVQPQVQPQPVQPQVQQPQLQQPAQPVQPQVQSQPVQPQVQPQPVQPQVQQPQPVQPQVQPQPVQPQVQPQPVQPQVQQPQPVQPQVQPQPVQPQVQQPQVPPVIPVAPPVDPAPVQPQRPMQQGFEGKTMMDTTSYKPQASQSTTPPPAPSQSTFRPQAPAAAVVTPAGGATPPPPAMNVPPTGQVPPGYQMPPQAPGAYKSPEVQAYLKKFNIGAFLMGPWWAIFHKVWIGLVGFVLPFIPAVGGLLQLAFIIYLGIKGSEMAWEKDERKDLAAFMKKQKTWMWVGIGFAIFSIVACVILFAVFGSALMSAYSSMY